MSALADFEPLIIEVRCNEAADRGQNGAVPFGPDEVVADAIAVEAEGAAILHWHPRDAVTGSPSTDPEVFQAVVDGVRARTDLLLHPTLGFVDTQNDPRGRVEKVIARELEPSRRVDMAPVDFGTFNADLWDPDALNFVTTDSVCLNSTSALLTMLEFLQENAVFVNCVCWSSAHVRTARAFQAAGLLSERVLWTFAFGGDQMPGVMGPTLPDLLACVAAIPDGDPWTVYCYHGDAMPLVAWATTLGGHVSVGIGDHPYGRFGYPRNSDLVRRVVAMAETLGRRVATPSQAREVLGMPSPVAINAEVRYRSVGNGE